MTSATMRGGKCYVKLLKMLFIYRKQVLYLLRYNVNNIKKQKFRWMDVIVDDVVRAAEQISMIFGTDVEIY